MLQHTVDPYAAALYCDFRSTFRLVDKTAAADATPSATNYNTNVSQLAQTHDGVEYSTAKYATLEAGGWSLDGSCKIMPDSVSGVQTGLWTGLSGADGIFATPPTLTFQFTSNHSSYGFTLLFDDKANWYPKSITLAAYNSTNALLGSKTIACTSVRQIVDLSVTNYRKIVLTFNSTQAPFQRVRLTEAIFGIVEYHDKSNMPEATISYEIDPRMKEFPCGEMVQVIDNSDGRYNMQSPNSLYAYLQKGQPFNSNEIGLGLSADSLEYVNMGAQFYFAQAKASNDSMAAEITAYDLIYQLDKTKYRKGVWTGTYGTDTVSNLINAVLSDSGVGLQTNIPADIGARVIGSIIPIVSHREAIRMICEAARCVAFIGRSGALQLATIVAGTPVDTLNGDNMTDWPEISVDDAVNTVEVDVYNYNSDATDETLYNATMTINGTQDIWVEFDPTLNPSASISGGTLNSATYYFRAAKLNITANGAVTIAVTGRKASASKSVYSANNITGDEAIQSYSIENELVLSNAVAAAIATYQLGLSRITCPFTDMGNPARELTDTVSISDAFGESSSAVVTKEKYTFDGGLACEVEAVST